MIETPQKKPPVKGWRSPLAVGLGTGLSYAVVRDVITNLEPSLGYFGAFALSLVAAGAIGGFVAWVVYLLVKPRGRVE